MNAEGKDGRKKMAEMRIRAERAAAVPKRDLMAAAVLERCRAFFAEPENEQQYRAWKENKKAADVGASAGVPSETDERRYTNEL